MNERQAEPPEAGARPQESPTETGGLPEDGSTETGARPQEAPTETGEAPGCAVHPSLPAAGTCSRCGEPRCAICFEDGAGGVCRDCLPSPTAIGRIRPNLRIVRRRPRASLRTSPLLWALAGLTGAFALTAGLLFSIAWADGALGLKLGIAGWASLHGEDLAWASLLIAVAVSLARPSFAGPS